MLVKREYRTFLPFPWEHNGPGSIHKVLTTRTHGVNTRLREMKQKTTERVRQQGPQGQQALVWLEKGVSDEDVLAVMGSKNARLGTVRRRAQTVNVGAYEQGRAVGRQVPLGSRASGALGSEKQALR